MSEKANMAQRYEHEIPEGYEARIEGNKVIIEKKESEDERIRKEIIDWMKGGSTYDWQENKEKWLAYLERQKEQKPAEKQDYSGLTDFERAIHRGFLCAGVENVPVTIIKETAQDCLAQIKPAEWSEMEEKDIQEASDYLRDYANKYVQGGNSKLYLQSLADRIESLCPQLKYEWSEEDEEWYMYLLGELNASIKDYCGAAEKDIKEAIRWFKSRYKSLRPQPHWKPSKEQMQALKKIIEYCRPIHNNSISGWDAFSGLCSLYNDLNKL